MEKIEIIKSRVIRLIPTVECGEELVDTRIFCPGFSHRIAEYLTDPREREDANFVRKSVAEMLNVALANLPEGYGFQIRCGLRSIRNQVEGYNAAYAELQLKHPDWSSEDLEDGVEEFCGAPDLAPHCTGGAMDLFPVDAEGNLLDIGCGLSEHTSRAVTVTDLITPAQQRNRGVFTDAMASSGLVNFPGEVWHWCYGETDWAAYGGHSPAIYGFITREDIITEGCA
jgi:D-alanyl-D-alanine dipeptidase